MIKVLVVDDSLEVQQSLGHLLGDLPQVRIVGYAQDAEGANTLVAQTHPDVVVLDVDLGGSQRGIDVLVSVVRQHPAARVIGLSNLTWQPVRASFLAAGASACFDKATEFSKARDWIADLERVSSQGNSSAD